MVDGLAEPTGLLVVVCDRLFEAAIGAPCGGAAEDRLVGELYGGMPAGGVERFPASARTSISVYGR
jgi:hypothetical protein